MKAFFLCFAVMHKGGFVHTDPRWQNLIWMARLCPRVIDFESAQKLGYEVSHFSICCMPNLCYYYMLSNFLRKMVGSCVGPFLQLHGQA